MTTVYFNGLKSGFQFIPFIKLLMTVDYRLKEAKEAADQLLDGTPLHVEIPSAAAATSLLSQAQRLGAVGYIA